MAARRRIAIVGGGISGLTAAFRLHRDHRETTEFVLFEASDRFGGIVGTVHRDGFVLECGPDSWVTEKPWARALAVELGLADQLLPSNDAQRRTYLARGGRLEAFPDDMRMMVPANLQAILHSPMFSASAQQAYLDEPSRAAELQASALLHRGPDADESIAAFVERHFGAEVASTVAGPLLAGVFGGDIHRLSARALLAPFVAMEAEHGSLVTALAERTPKQSASVFTTLRSGLGTLIDALVAQLPQAALRRATPVVGLEQRGPQWFIRTDTPGGDDKALGNHEALFDAVVLAAPRDATCALLRALPLAAAHDAASCLPADASSSAIVALGYHADAAAGLRTPPGFGLLVAPGTDTANSLLACTFVHQKFAHRVPPGGALLRAFFSSTAADQLSAANDADLVAEARRQLAALLGPLPAGPDISLVRRWPRSMPQYEVGHLARIERLHAALARLPGLAVVGNASHGVGLPDLVREAAAAAAMVARRPI